MIIVRNYYKKEIGERERLQAYFDLKFHEKHGHFFDYNSKGAEIARRIILTKRCSIILYEKQKQRLIDAIILDIKSKGEKRES